MIIAGQTKDLMAAVHLASDGSQVATGTIYCVIRLESDDADNGKYWDGDSWEAVPAAWPVGTHTQAGQWAYELPATATAGKPGCVVHHSFTDDLDETLATTVCGGGEHYVSAGTPATEPAGLRQITIHIQDGASAPVPDVSVAIYDSSNTTPVARHTTDAGGDIVVALDDGEYKVRLRKAGWLFTVPESLAVVADGSTPYTGAAWVPSEPSDPGMCVIWGWLRDAARNPHVGARVVAISVTPQGIDADQFTKVVVSEEADETGYFEIELAQGLEVHLKIPVADIDERRVVPELAGLKLKDWQ